jgi:hypothetical protein
VGDKSCQNGAPAECDASGQLVVKDPCTGQTGTCLNGACVQCSPGTKRCDGDNVPQTCSAEGTWQGLDMCPMTAPVCNAGTCSGTRLRGGFVTNKASEGSGMRVRGGFLQAPKACGNNMCVRGGFRP